MFEWTSVDHVALTDSYSPVAARRRRGRSTSSTSTRSTSTLTARCSCRAATPGPPTTSTPRPVRSSGRWAASTRASRRARGAATAFQHDARPIGANAILAVRQRRDPPGAPPVARRRARDRPGDEGRQRPQQFLHRGPPLLAQSQGEPAGAARRQLVRRLGPGAGPLGVQPDRSAPVRREPTPPDTSPTGRCRFPWHADAGRARRRSPRGRGATPTSAGTGRPASRAGSCGRAAPPRRSAHIGSVGAAGFETAIPLLPSRSERYVRSAALDAVGHVLAASALARSRPPPSGAARAQLRRVLLAAGDERGGRTTQRELARRPVGVRPRRRSVRPSRTSTIVTGSGSPPKCQTAPARRGRGSGREGLIPPAAGRGRRGTRCRWRGARSAP